MNLMKIEKLNSVGFMLAIGLLIGAYHFFHPIWPISGYLDSPQRSYIADNYWNFSDSIFRPQTVFYAESVLMPLIGKAIGASSSLLAYQFYSAVLTVLLMPIICVAFRSRIVTTKGLIFSIIAFACTFRYLRDYTLGAPDPLVMILLVLATCSRPKAMVACIVLAGLTHFSLTVFALIAVLPLQLLHSRQDEDRSVFQQIKYAFSAVVLSKVILIGWYYIFDYQLTSRLHLTLEMGSAFFLQRLIENPFQFFYTPGPFFCAVNIAIFSYFLFKRLYLVCVAQAFALFVCYFVLLITLDGLRIFSVVAIGAYFNLLVLWFNQVFKSETTLKNSVIPSTLATPQ